MKRIQLKKTSLDAWEKYLREEIDGRKPQVYDPIQGQAVYQYVIEAFIEAIRELRKHSQ